MTAHAIDFKAQWVQPETRLYAVVLNVPGSGDACGIYDEDTTECINTQPDISACTFTSCKAASGVVVGDPLFVDAANGDFHLANGSPCIGTGIDPTAWYSDAIYDIDGQLRPISAGDIGADER